MFGGTHQEAKRKNNVLSSVALLRITLLLIISLSPAGASIVCEDDDVCIEKYRAGSKCVRGLCSNPFVSGCLQRYLGKDKYPNIRVCNSEDPPNATDNGICFESPFGYDEIRILSANWESSMFSAWIMQIVLSELAGVPSTIESGSSTRNFNFYDPENSFSYGTMTYDYDALRTASTYPDCRDAPSGVSCAHVLPEVWNGQNHAVQDAEREGFIESEVSNGAVGKLSWYVLKFTAEKDPTLLSIFGLTDMAKTFNGKSNRRKLAETFKRPFTWKDYCEMFTADNCTTADEVAERAPETPSESAKYFVRDVFNGKFNATDENDCDANPTTCTGHIVTSTCEWSTWVIPQAHYLNITVKSNGPGSTGSYTYGQQIEVLEAAVATQSDILFYWWTPDYTLQSYMATKNELQKINLANPTQKCMDSRISVEQRCSKDPSDWIGKMEGSCDAAPYALQKLIASNLREKIYNVDEALRSPGYDIIKSITISNLQLEQIFEIWNSRSTDMSSDAREAVCMWVAENLDSLKSFIPRTYPRSMRFSPPGSIYIYMAMVLGGIVMVLVIFNWVIIWLYQEEKVIRCAQPMILYLFLTGLMFVSMGAVAYAITPSNISCVIRMWLTYLGYTLELVPLIVKVGTINKIYQSSLKLKLVRISPNTIYKTIGSVVGIVVVFLSVWTAVDPPTRQEEHVLTKEDNPNGGVYVDINNSCITTSSTWMSIAMSYQMILLISGTILAFQNRNLVQKYNESSKLAFVVYAQFIFFLLRVLIVIFSSYLTANAAAAMTSIILSLDVLVTLSIYFAPKIIVARASKEAKLNATATSMSPNSRRSVKSNDKLLETVENHFENLKKTLDEVNGLLAVASIDLAAMQIHNVHDKKDSEKGKVLDEQVKAMKKTLADIQDPPQLFVKLNLQRDF
mmetsp:Transcript_28694/g.57251  ORF Transcript_28694/g.57251 Transcript_28694/m.57251 type:complete len:909 (-) Transcript_28694:96-2822(-)